MTAYKHPKDKPPAKGSEVTLPLFFAKFSMGTFSHVRGCASVKYD